MALVCECRYAVRRLAPDEIDIGFDRKRDAATRPSEPVLTARSARSAAASAASADGRDCVDAALTALIRQCASTTAREVVSRRTIAAASSVAERRHSSVLIVRLRIPCCVMDEAVDRIDWARIRYARDRAPLAEASFVLSAIGVDHYIAQEPDGWALLVPAAFAQLADSELEKYRNENRWTPQRKPTVIVVDRMAGSVSSAICSSSGCCRRSNRSPLIAVAGRRHDAGESRARGEWWRTVRSA
jgi:hypothetical protein